MKTQTIQQPEDNRPRCKKCNSTQVYMRLGTNQRICQKCAWVENHVNDLRRKQ